MHDPTEFMKYFDHFQQYAAQYSHNIPPVDNLLAIGFGPTQDADVAGLCEWNFLNGRQIVINQSEWEQIDDLSRESLVFHELGHCVLKRGHVTDTIIGTDAGATDKNSYPKSLMNPVFVSGDVYHHLQDYYLRELFGDI